MEEQWKTISKSPNYLISTLGRVRNKRTLRLLNQSFQKSGNAIVCLSDGGRIKTYSVNRLMLEAFKPCEGSDSMSVLYKDGIKGNNTIENLEWGEQKMTYNTTPTEFKDLTNMLHKYIDKAINEWFAKYGLEIERASDKEQAILP